MKYILFLSIFIFALTCQKATTSPDAVVTAITTDEIHFSDGTKQRFPMENLEESTIFICVRHAEKATGQDPDLTTEGQARADRLATILQNSDLFKVYSTVTNRTLQTAMPTIEALGCEHGSYKGDQLEDFINTLLEHKAGKRFLIVGHSNTTPDVVNHLLRNAVYEHINHDDYGTFFVVASHGVGSSEVLKPKF